MARLVDGSSSLDRQAWLADLAIECLDGEGSREGAMLEQASKLFQFPIYPAQSQTGLRRQFELALACGAYESASLRLLPPGSSYMLSRSARGSCIVTVKLSGCAEVTLQANTLALGLVGCLATALANAIPPSRDRERRVPAVN